MSQPGEFDPALLRQIFDRQIRPRHIDSIPPGQPERPVLVILGGQPGAGKTRAGSASRSDHPGVVAVIGDDFRRYHPQYDNIMDTEPLRMPEVTAQAANAWVHMSLDYLQGERRSVLLETTLRQPDAVEATLRQFHDAGYRTELRVLAVPGELSRMGTVTRYVGQVVEDGAGRWAPSRFHDAAYANAPGSIARAVAAGLVDRVVVVDRSANVLAGMAIDPATAGRQVEELCAVIEAGREASSITPTQGRVWLRELADNARHLAEWGESDADLLAAVHRLDSRVEAVATAAWPDDPARAVTEARRAHAAVAAVPSPPSERQTLSRRIEKRRDAAKRARDDRPAAESRSRRRGPEVGR